MENDPRYYLECPRYQNRTVPITQCVGCPYVIREAYWTGSRMAKMVPKGCSLKRKK